jgi:predicted glycoside hydrolase/deacetylase ChbG (UPF0249 family)
MALDPYQIASRIARYLMVPCALGVTPPLTISGQATTRAVNSSPVYLVIRTDDAGMSHSVNMALERLIETRMPVTVSVMFACPWYQETVEILKRHPEVSIGIHLTLNSEWKDYRWGPVTGREAVPTLVDSNGYFFPSSEALHDNHPALGEIEKELRAQIERALHSGLTIDYVDAHMGTALRYPEFREITERLAREYRLGVMGYFGETIDSPQYWASPHQKADSLVALVGRLQSGVTVVVTHLGIDNAELGALVDMNTDEPLPEMSKNRQGELDALTSSRFARAVKARNVVLITYREVIHQQGLEAMRRPAG